MNTFVVICYLVNVAVFAFAVTRPSAAWLAADRNRTFWLSLLVILGLMGVLGLAADVGFLAAVLPRMLADSVPQPEDPRVRPNPFLKN